MAVIKVTETVGKFLFPPRQPRLAIRGAVSRNSKIDFFFISSKNVADYSASREKHDLGFLTFDLQTDLTSLFNWNVKELFLYLTAEYQTDNNELNQVVLWDKILLRGENAVLDFKNMNTKYYFWDDGNGLK